MCNLKTKQQEQQTNSQKKRSDLQLPEVERDFDDGGQKLKSSSYKTNNGM